MYYIVRDDDENKKIKIRELEDIIKINGYTRCFSL